MPVALPERDPRPRDGPDERVAAPQVVLEPTRLLVRYRPLQETGPPGARGLVVVVERQALCKQVAPVVGMESRGFIFAAPIAYKLGVGFVPVRKLGKLPSDVVSVEYDLEYGSATLEMHKDALKPGARVLIVDDLLATGGTVAGTIELVKQLKGEIVGLAFLIELSALKGREKLSGFDIVTLISY